MSGNIEYREALDYIESLTALGWKPGLERFSELCRRLGDPQKKLRTLLVGGTNGKGSTTAMIASILRSAGFRVGAYYSPYLYDIRERVQLDLEMITEEEIVRNIGLIRPHAAALAETEFGHPTEFEVKTALAFLSFADREVDFAVLEVGLGGRLDATNIVESLVSVITNVTLDHTDRLGTTIAEIAVEKAGIIKERGHTITASADPDALEVIRRTCAERDSLLWEVYPVIGAPGHLGISAEPLRPSDFQDGTSVLTVEGVRGTYPGIRVGMRGSYQFLNAATAVGAVEVLADKGFDVPESAVRQGLETAYLPGRLEVLRTEPTLLIDAAHNLDAARILARELRSFSYENLILVMGMVSGHSISDVVGVLAPLADRFYATAPDNPRAAPASAIASEARRHCSRVQEVEPVSEAVRQALDSAGSNDLVCVTGSFYTIGEVPRGSAES